MNRTKRLIGHVQGSIEGPTVVLFGGIHGNEMAGVKAMKKVFEELDAGSYGFKGSLYGIYGNMPAQLKGKRFLKHDLNRLWTPFRIVQIRTKSPMDCSIEEIELLEILDLTNEIIDSSLGPIYFIDFHTTSSKTLPFITINDALINRRFSQIFPVPVILGMEEYLKGPLLSYINERGYVSLGFESGQHTEPNAVRNSIAFIWLAITYVGVLDKEHTPDFQMHFEQLRKSAKGNARFYEIIFRHALEKGSAFAMYPGFESFQKVEKGTSLGIHNQIEVKIRKDSILFMPLYQVQGEEGYFLIKKIPVWALRLSTFLRKIGFDNVLTNLPGVSWSDEKKEKLLVNFRVARFLTKPFFHLLGYRNRTLNRNYLLMQNRERTAKTEMYKNEWWYKAPN